MSCNNEGYCERNTIVLRYIQPLKFNAIILLVNKKRQFSMITIYQTSTSIISRRSFAYAWSLHNAYHSCNSLNNFNYDKSTHWKKKKTNRKIKAKLFCIIFLYSNISFHILRLFNLKISILERISQKYIHMYMLYMCHVENFYRM